MSDPTPASLRAAFAAFDADGSGALDAAELTAILTRSGGGGPLSEAEAQEFICRFDVNGDGVLQVDELIAALTAPGERLAQLSTAAASSATEAQKKQGRTNADFNEFDALLATIESGAVRPLRGRYVVDLWRRGGRLSRRQDLPPEAFWSAAELRELREEILSDKYTGSSLKGLVFGSHLVALSYRWLSKAHPDPDGIVLAIVAEVAEIYLKSPLLRKVPATDSGPPAREADFAIFWDFCVLPQGPERTPEETALFREGLGAANIWYGHQHTLTWINTELPDGFAEAMASAGLAPSYETSGWCFVESAMSSVLSGNSSRIDLAKRMSIKQMGHLGNTDPFLHLRAKCRTGRSPPLLPAAVCRLLREEKQFTSGADEAKVAHMYEEFFEAVAPHKEELWLSGLDWDAADAEALVEALPRFERCRKIILSRNPIGDAGCKALAALLRDGHLRSLQYLELNECMIGDEGVTALAEAIAGHQALEKLFLRRNEFSPSAEEAIDDACRAASQAPGRAKPLQWSSHPDEWPQKTFRFTRAEVEA